MDRPLLKRLLNIGMMCLVVAVAAMICISVFWISSATYVNVTAFYLLLVAGFIVLMIAAGVLTVLMSPEYRDRPGTIILASAVAGAAPVVALSITYWGLIASSFFIAGPFGGTINSRSLAAMGNLFLLDLCLIGVAALLAGLSGAIARKLTATACPGDGNKGA